MSSDRMKALLECMRVDMHEAQFGKKEVDIYAAVGKGFNVSKWAVYDWFHGHGFPKWGVEEWIVMIQAMVCATGGARTVAFLRGGVDRVPAMGLADGLAVDAAEAAEAGARLSLSAARAEADGRVDGGEFEELKRMAAGLGRELEEVRRHLGI